MTKNDIFDVKNLDTHIYIIDNVLNNEECDSIIKYINDSNNVNVKDDGIVRAHLLHLYENNLSDIKMNEQIYKLCNKIFRSIMHKNPFININGDVFYHLRKIYKETSLHIDEVRSTLQNFIDNKTRTIALIINLNDDYEGGVFNFPKQNIQHRLKRGSAILFPPFWTHPHEVSNVSSFRYTITTWGTERLIVDK